MLIDKLQVFVRDRFFIALAMCCFSAFFFTASYLMYKEPRLEPDYESKRDADMKECKAFAEHKGFAVTPDGRSVMTISSTRLDDPGVLFATLETVVVACRNIELKTVCMGVEQQCGLNGTKMTLTYEKPQAY
jgi:hypothetical protein